MALSCFFKAGVVSAWLKNCVTVSMDMVGSPFPLDMEDFSGVHFAGGGPTSHMKCRDWLGPDGSKTHPFTTFPSEPGRELTKFLVSSLHP
jgi:hypothetical protein